MLVVPLGIPVLLQHHSGLGTPPSGDGRKSGDQPGGCKLYQPDSGQDAALSVQLNLPLPSLRLSWFWLRVPATAKVEIFQKAAGEVLLTSPPAPLLQGEGSPAPPFPCREGG